MRQVPQKIPLLVIGSGRLAQHIRYYYKLEGLEIYQWARSHGLSTLKENLNHVERVALMISDAAIAPFYREHKPLFAEKMVFHCSGAMVDAEIPSLHPLMTFGPEFYDLRTYQKIFFVSERGRQTAQELLPEFHNPSVEIPSEIKPFYHALCVCGGNLVTLLWSEVIQDFEKNHIPAAALEPYFGQILKNILQNRSLALTGPLARRDWPTVQKNLASLKGSRLRSIYHAFVEWFPDIHQKLDRELETQ